MPSLVGSHRQPTIALPLPEHATEPTGTDTSESIELRPGCKVVRSVPLPNGGDAVIRWSTNPQQLVFASVVFVPLMTTSPPSHTHTHTKHNAASGELVISGGEGSLRLAITHISTGWFYDATTTLTLNTSIELHATHAVADETEANEYNEVMHGAIEQVDAARPNATQMSERHPRRSHKHGNPPNRRSHEPKQITSTIYTIKNRCRQRMTRRRATPTRRTTTSQRRATTRRVTTRRRRTARIQRRATTRRPRTTTPKQQTRRWINMQRSRHRHCHHLSRICYWHSVSQNTAGALREKTLQRRTYSSRCLRHQTGRLRCV